MLIKGVIEWRESAAEPVRHAAQGGGSDNN
jgi:hypothetical protein